MILQIFAEYVKISQMQKNRRNDINAYFKNTSVMNFENAIRGARNPMNSWGRMDSHTEPDGSFVFGPNDLDLAMRLAKAGSDHRKYLRMVLSARCNCTTLLVEGI